LHLLHLVLLFRIVDITIVSTSVISTFIKFSNAIGNDIFNCFFCIYCFFHITPFIYILLYKVIFNNPIPTATKNTAKTSNSFGFFSLLFITKATNIVNTIETGFVYELNTTEFEDK